MVSTDGPRITPDDPNPRDDDPADRAGIEASTPEAEETSTAVAEAPQRNGNGRPKRRKKKKPRERRSRIDRLVMEFQPDAVELEYRKVAGGLRWTLYTVILLLISAVVWASWAKVDRVVVAEGQLKPRAKPVVIQSVSINPIISLEIEMGDIVEAGELIAKLDPTLTQADATKLEGEVNGYAAKYARLEAEQNEQPFDISEHAGDAYWETEYRVFVDRGIAYRAKLDEFAATKSKLIMQKETHEAEIEMYTEQVAALKEMLDVQVGLEAKRVAAELEVVQRRLQWQSSKAQLVDAENKAKMAVEEHKAEQTREDSFVAAEKAKISEALAETRRALNASQEELNKAVRALELSELRVPDNLPHKVFSVIEVAEQSVVQPGQPVAKLVPADDVIFEAEVKVEARDIARIRGAESSGSPQNFLGDDVRLKLSAYPYMKHGTLNGKIRAISEDIFEEGQAPMTKTFYKVRVKIDPGQELKDVPGDFRLINGMTVTAEIKIGRRRVIEYFLYPILRALDGSIREP